MRANIENPAPERREFGYTASFLLGVVNGIYLNFKPGANPLFYQALLMLFLFTRNLFPDNRKVDLAVYGVGFGTGYLTFKITKSFVQALEPEVIQSLNPKP